MRWREAKETRQEGGIRTGGSRRNEGEGPAFATKRRRRRRRRRGGKNTEPREQKNSPFKPTNKMSVTNITSFNYTAHPEKAGGSERHTEKRERESHDYHNHHHGNRLAKRWPVLPGCSAHLIWYNLTPHDEMTSKSLNLQLRDF